MNKLNDGKFKFIGRKAMKNLIAAKLKTPEQIADMNKDIESCRIRVSKELKSLHPNRNIIRIKVAHISHLNHLMKYGYGVK